MSDKLKRVLDTNLAGLHVTDAQMRAVMQRVSQDNSTKRPPRANRYRALAAVLLVLVLGAGILLQAGILPHGPQEPNPDVTRQGDYLTAAQVKKLLRDAAELQLSPNEEALSELLAQVEADGGCSLSALLEALCPPGSTVGQWDIHTQVAINQLLEEIGYQGLLPGMTRDPLPTEITPQEALSRAVTHVRTNDDPQADFTNPDFYRVGIRFLSGVYDGTCEGAYYCVNFDALDAFGTTYEVAVDAESGRVCRMRRERGAGSNHTADEITRGFRRIFGYDLRTWTPLQLRVYTLALGRADTSSLQTVHELFLRVGRDGFPDIPDDALSREDAISAALALQKASKEDVLAAEYLAGTPDNLWKVAIRQSDAPSGQSIVYLELDGTTGALLTTTYAGNLYGLPQEFFPSQLLSSLGHADVSRSVPTQDDAALQSAASAAIEHKYQRNMTQEGYSCFIESDLDSEPGSFSYDTGSGIVIFAKDAQHISQGDTYWVALDWYGSVLDLGWNCNPLDAARFALVMQGYLPASYDSSTIQQLQAILTSDLTDDDALRQMESDGTLVVFNALLSQEALTDVSTVSTHDDILFAAMKALNAHAIYDSSTFLLFRDEGALIWHCALSTDMGCYLLDVRDSDQTVVDFVQIACIGDPWSSTLLPVRVWRTLPESVRSRSALSYSETDVQPGIIYGMRADYIVRRYTALYGANILLWDQATLSAFQSAMSMSSSANGEMSVPCLQRTIYPAIPENAISRSVAAEYAARALGEDGGTLRGGVLIDPGDGNSLWKVTLDFPDGRSFCAEVDCRTGAVQMIRQRHEKCSILFADYNNFPADAEYWFRDFVLDAVIEQVESDWHSDGNG